MSASPSHQQLLILPENRRAFQSLQKLAKSKGKPSARLLYLYGPAGSGKSHLIRQFAREYSRTHRNLKSQVLTASEFAAQFANATDSKNLDSFRSLFRNLDLFVCEDLQAIRGRRETLKELVLTLDELAEKNATVIFTANSLPGHWTKFNSRLVDRCHAGLSVAIELPNQQGRAKLVQHFFQSAHIPAAAPAVALIAAREDCSPRDLEGIVSRVIDLSQRHSQKVTPELVERILKKEVTATGPSLREIIKTTAKHFDLKVRDLKSSSRRADVVFARQCSMYLARELTEQTLQEIARELGKADHTAVIRANSKIESLVANDSETRHELMKLREELRAG